MGTIIVKNIRKMGWKARIGLIAIFTLAFSVLLYQGWNGVRQSEAAIQTLTAWTNVYHSATLPNNTTVNSFAVSAAARSRMLVVAITNQASSSAALTTYTVSYGGTALTYAGGDATTSLSMHTMIYYLKDTPAVMDGTSRPLVVTIAGGGSSVMNNVWYSVYTGVDQSTTPVETVRNYNSGSTAVTSAAFATALTVNANEKAIMVASAARASAAVTWNAATNWTKNNNQPSGTTGLGFVASRTIPSTNSTDTASSTGITSSRVSMTGMSMKAATTTRGNGTAGTTGNVAPGASAQKLDGFSLAASTGATDSITGLTVTTTNQAAIASLQVWNEAGTTQYFTTVNNPGSNTWSFSGGTAIPVTATAANFKILATYKTRVGGAPAGSTATTAFVSALTGTNVAAGTDSADTTLTLSNVHAASTWGTNTAGNAQVTLNWSYGTAGQSVIIVRYPTNNTDTTKPVDGTTYSSGGAYGVGGTVRYVGAGSTFTDSVGVANGTTYYYKIFEYDTYSNYYNLTDVWTAGLTPVSPDAVAPTVDAGFAATTPVNSVTVPITSFGATDNVGGSGVAGYLITTSSAQPLASAIPSGSAPTSFTAAGQGAYTLYPWAKDAGGNVSGLYGAPVQVVVDLTKPTVATFSVTGSVTQVASRNVPISPFTAADTGGSGMAAYIITTTSTPPAANDPGWSGSAPGIFPVLSDGSYILYPWVKDAAGNVSTVFGSPRTVLVDTTAPTVPVLLSPADEATDLPLATTLTSSTATDSGSGGVKYWFQVDGNDVVYSQNSGWISGTSFAPTGLSQGSQYLWTVKAKDALGIESVFATPRSFTITAPCVRNDPTITLLTSGGGIATTISTDSGTSTYNLRLINNDTGSCGSTQFNLTINDTDLLEGFDNSTFDNMLTTKAITLNPSRETTTPITVRATPNHDSGVERTIVYLAADAYHAAAETGFVQTTLNVVTCVPKVPLLIVGPDSGYLNKGGKMVYTITVRNTDTGAGCSPVTFNLSVPAETNSTDFNASQLSVPSLTLNSGELGSATLTVSAKLTAVRNAVNQTATAVAASGHTAPGNVIVISTVNNPMLHNSDNTSSTKWSVSGGWGIPNGRYGEIDCNTCHVGGGGDTANIKRVNEKIFTPYTSGGLPRFPGEGKSIAYRRYIGNTAAKPVFGWDAGATPRTTPATTKICEACHTYDATRVNGSIAHPYATSATLGNHFNTDGTDCTRCHKHNKGFGGGGNMACNSCHGDSNVTAAITAANRYVVAPPKSSTGKTGVLAGNGQVSNDPKVGAHQTHLIFSNGFSNYSTVEFRCVNCHGTLPVSGSPTQFEHANGSSTPVFQGLANNRNARTPSFSSLTLTCSNTYCHNPAGTGGTLASANAGLAILPSWSSASYLTDSVRKSQSNCNRCHKVPGDAGFSYQGSHGSMVTDQATDCSGCHGHNGDAAGSIGQRHVDGIRYITAAHEYGFGGRKHMPGGTGTIKAEAAPPYSSCGCHDRTTAGGSYPVTRYVAANILCSSCHKNTANFTTTPGCADCHGSNATGQPNGGTAFPNWSGSHTAHTAMSYACADCHAGGGSGAATHGNYSGILKSSRTTPGQVTVAFNTVKSGTAATWAAGSMTCSTTICHGQKSPNWGQAVPANQCFRCHGSQSTATYLNYTQSSIAPGTGNIDTNRATGVTPRGGAHQEHLRGLSNMSRKVRCVECHVLVTAVNSGTHLNYTTSTVTFSGVAIAPPAAPHTPTRTRVSGVSQCSNTYCHTANRTGATAFSTTPLWNNAALMGNTTIADTCTNKCHALPPGNAANGGVSGDTHFGLASVTTPAGLSACSSQSGGTGCHPTLNGAPTAMGNIWFNKDLHIDGVVQGGDCLSCHSKVQGTRAAVVGQFASQSHHIQGNEVLTKASCYKCHWEATSAGDEDPVYHSKTSGKGVSLVVWKGSTTRPTSATAATLISYTANGSRKQILKLNDVCLGCHDSTAGRTAPFGTYATDQYSPEPKMVPALGKTSILSRYSSTRTVPWSNYAFTNSSGQVFQYGTNQKSKITKALSAHGNAVKNQFPNWVATANGTGEDETMADIAASATLSSNRNVLCYDCHNSHGSDAAGITSSYSSATGRYKGGLLKSTIAGQGGYTATYKPAARTINYKNYSTTATTAALFNAGASICNDCHNKDTQVGQTAITRPWSIISTYSSTKALVGYWSTPYFGNYTFASTKRSSYKAGARNNGVKDLRTPMGGHYGSSVNGTQAAHSGEINGLCTPCHDPHGVSSAMTAVNRGKSVPLLKGTWVTSPYREDRATPVVKRGGGSNFTGIAAMGAMPGYNIDQNTLINLPAPLNGGAFTTTAKSNKRAQAFTAFPGAAGNALALHTEKTPADFAGLCIGCHAQGTLTNATAPAASNWMSKERVHQSVAGWAATTGSNANGTVHAYTCSKCHAPHVSRLPRLMVTNCLDVRHVKQVIAGGSVTATTPATSPGFAFGNVLQSYASSAYGAGRFPAGGSRYSGTPASAQNNGPWFFQTVQPAAATYGSNCHNATTAGGATYDPTKQIWNKKTRW